MLLPKANSPAQQPNIPFFPKNTPNANSYLNVQQPIQKQSNPIAYPNLPFPVQNQQNINHYPNIPQNNPPMHSFNPIVPMRPMPMAVNVKNRKN